MPSSRHYHITFVISLVRSIYPVPKSILDIGIGYAKWGHLFREYFDIIKAEDDFSFYQKENWQTTIDGIEGYEPYITPMHKYLYNNIYLGNMLEIINQVGNYDLIFIGDVIEHVAKDDGIRFLKNCLNKANSALIVTTPAIEVEQGALCDNDYENHKAHYTRKDFNKVAKNITTVTKGDVRIVIFCKNQKIKTKLLYSIYRWKYPILKNVAVYKLLRTIKRTFHLFK